MMPERIAIIGLGAFALAMTFLLFLRTAREARRTIERIEAAKREARIEALVRQIERGLPPIILSDSRIVPLREVRAITDEAYWRASARRMVV